MRSSRGGSPMLQVSDIQSSQEELQEYYAQLAAQHVTPAWIGGGISVEPQSQALPHLWHWREVGAQAMRAAARGGSAQGGPPGVRLRHPHLPRRAPHTPVAQ